MLSHYPSLPIHVFPVLLDSGLFEIRMVSHSGNMYDTSNSANHSYLLIPAPQEHAPRLAQCKGAEPEQEKSCWK